MARAQRSSDTAALHGRAVGRYLMFGQIGAGGTATVHFGRVRGSAGFCRTVALKRLHRNLAQDPYFVSLFLAEARTAARVSHPNVVPLIDVIRMGDGELLLVMEYVHGETLATLLAAASRAGTPIPPRVAVAIISGALAGLHAAHEALDPRGTPLGLVHGDVSPRNIIVGADGSARLLDFGTARASATRNGRVIGTPAYMAPEQLKVERPDRRSDVFGAGVVLWEMLTLRRLFTGTKGRLRVAEWDTIPAPSRFNPGVSSELDAVVLKASRLAMSERPSTALACALALEQSCPPASAREVAAWVQQTGGDRLRTRAADLARIETASPDWAFEGAGPGEATVTRLHGDGDGDDHLDPSQRLGDDQSGDESHTCDSDCSADHGGVPGYFFREDDSGYHRDTSGLAEALARPTPRLAISTQASTEFRRPILMPIVQPAATACEAGPLEIPSALSAVRAFLAGLPGPRSRAALFMAVAGCAVVGLLVGRVGRSENGPAVVAVAPAVRASTASAGVFIERRAREDVAVAPASAAAPQPARSRPPAPPQVDEPASALPATQTAPAFEDALPAMRTVHAAPVFDDAQSDDSTSATAEPQPAILTVTAAAPLGRMAAARQSIGALNRRAMLAYEQLDRQTALRLLSEALRRCELSGLARSDVAARTHLELGVVLAGGFKQPGLGAKHFRLARQLQPGLVPAARLSTPDIALALQVSATSDAGDRTASFRRR